MSINSWADFETKTATWIAANAGHSAIPQLHQLLASADRLRNVKIKDIRNVILAITETKKSWEVIVGQALADAIGMPSKSTDPFGLFVFVGANAVKTLLHAT